MTAPKALYLVQFTWRGASRRHTITRVFQTKRAADRFVPPVSFMYKGQFHRAVYRPQEG